MQYMGANVYNYLLVKVIELLTLEGVKYPNKGILKSAYKYIRENPEFAYPICRMYPEEIRYSSIAKNETTLCMDLLKKSNNTSIRNLDNLVYFTEGVMTNARVAREVISILAEELPLMPQYRFEYKDSAYLGDGSVNHNKLLDTIFAAQYPVNERYEPKLYKNLMNIEPVYALKIKDMYFDITSTTREEALRRSVGAYAMRYGIRPDENTEYVGKDILTNPNESTKRLIRCIKNNKDNIY